MGLGNYLQNSNREGFISANKEGIFSMFGEKIHFRPNLTGYLALFLIGAQVGSTLLKPRKSLSQWKTFAVALLVLDALLWVATLLANELIEKFSRRMVRHVCAILNQF
jgi:hypothetical protein